MTPSENGHNSYQQLNEDNNARIAVKLTIIQGENLWKAIKDDPNLIGLIAEVITDANFDNMTFRFNRILHILIENGVDIREIEDILIKLTRSDSNIVNFKNKVGEVIQKKLLQHNFITKQAIHNRNKLNRAILFEDPEFQEKAREGHLRSEEAHKRFDPEEELKKSNEIRQYLWDNGLFIHHIAGILEVSDATVRRIIVDYEIPIPYSDNDLRQYRAEILAKNRTKFPDTYENRSLLARLYMENRTQKDISDALFEETEIRISRARISELLKNWNIKTEIPLELQGAMEG